MKANTYVVKPFGISEVKVIALKGDPGTPTQEQINTAVDEYMTEHPEAQIPDGSITEQKLSSDVVATLNEVDNKADKVGSYPDLIAGTADNLLSSSYQTDRTPYLLRRTPYGAREKGSIVGGSIVWNQLLQPLNSNDWRAESGVTATYTDGVATVSSTTANNGIYHLSYLNVQLHKYLITFDANGASGLTIALSVSGAQGMAVSGNGTGTWARYSAVVNCTGGAGSRRTYLLARGSTYENVMFRNVMLFDLTLMFGPAIADYIYAQEQATAGAGVALAKAWAGITADYYPYDAGSIKSVTGLTAHRMTDGNGDVIGEYPLDSSLTLRGLLKLDGGSLYYDGDIYPPSGEVERRYRQMTITGTENWAVVNGRFSITITPQGSTKTNKVIVMSTAFVPDTADNLYVNRTAEGYIGIAVNTGRVFIVDNVNFATKDVSAFKTYLQGLNSAGHPLTILYELAEPTTEQAEPYTELQICDPSGTEEWVGASMPVGHETQYYEDLKGKIEDIPDAPSADGTYTLRVTVSNGVATYSWE